MLKNGLRNYSGYFFFAAFLVFAVLSLLVIRPFISSIIIGLFLCYIFYPVYRRILSLIKNETVAASVMTALVCFVIILPFALVSQLVIVEVLDIYSKFNLQATISWFTTLFTPQMQEVLVSFTKQGLSMLASLLSSFVLSLPQKLLNGFVLLMTLFVTFKSGNKIFESFKMALPIKESYKREFVSRFSQTSDAILYGALVVSLVEGIAAMVGFYIFGVSSPALWGFVTFLAALLPLIGPAIVWVPVVTVKYLSGDVSSAIGLMVYSIVVQNILLELMLKTKIIGSKGKIPPMITLLGILGGVMTFGIVGILLGPIILVIFIEFLKVYLGKNAFSHKAV